MTNEKGTLIQLLLQALDYPEISHIYLFRDRNNPERLAGILLAEEDPEGLTYEEFDRSLASPLEQ